MTYRNDHEAALARIAALEAELEVMKRELVLATAPLPRVPSLPGLPPIRPPRARTKTPPEFSETEGWEELHRRLKAERRRLGTNREVEPKPAPSPSLIGAVASMWAVLIVLGAIALAIVG